jgi:DNA-binding protein HU-beta
MNKGDLIMAVAENLSFSKKNVGEVIDEVITLALKSLASKEEVKFSGFGTFHVIERGARTGRNPKTGETVDVPAKSVVRFKPAKAVKELFV